jgi:hypothetical protein
MSQRLESVRFGMRFARILRAFGPEARRTWLGAWELGIGAWDFFGYWRVGLGPYALGYGQ